MISVLLMGPTQDTFTFGQRGFLWTPQLVNLLQLLCVNGLITFIALKR